jgi:hypothetical protein
MSASGAHAARVRTSVSRTVDDPGALSRRQWCDRLALAVTQEQDQYEFGRRASY